VEIPFTAEQQARLMQIAHEEGVAPEVLVREAAERLIEDDERFRAAVQAGLPADNAGLFALKRDGQASLLPELPARKRRNEEKICPVCGHRFKGRGWDGIDAHWRARHEAILPYERAWPLLRSGRYRLRMGRER
jgi:predicted transcriptional regulator